MELAGQEAGNLVHVERASEIYFELVKERRLPSPYRSLTEKIARAALGRGDHHQHVCDQSRNPMLQMGGN